MTETQHKVKRTGENDPDNDPPSEIERERITTGLWPSRTIEVKPGKVVVDGDPEYIKDRPNRR